ncbi:hypothetical protein OO256_16150, partial [Pseudomonas sp. DCB_CB]|uniref:hypothetical protein n=1 Tax=unclassified Pseudomonas TaxID=196821 RepID=UPI0022492889
LGHLLDRFDLELFGVTLTTHGTSYLGLIMRLGGVYETRGDSVYSPDTCAFIPPDLNRFMVDSQAIRGDLPIGVSWHKARQRFVAQCRNPFTGRHEFLGYHTSASEAHQAWREHKHRIAIAYAETQSDHRIAAALRTRYAA